MKKRKSLPTKKGPVASFELQQALDRFPEVVKRKEKAAKEKLKITKNFLSVKSKVYK